jgi:hypothetical protein
MSADLNAVIKEGCFNCTVLNQVLAINYTIKATFEASLNFSMHGDAHSFFVTKWSKKGFSNFARAFFQWGPRDEGMFGSMTIDDDGTPDFSKLTTQNKVAIVEQGLKDIMRCLNLIATKYKRSVIDYAVWYRERHDSYDAYDLYITLLACHLIVHTDFLAPDVVYDIVRFV